VWPSCTVKSRHCAVALNGSMNNSFDSSFWQIKIRGIYIHIQILSSAIGIINS